MEAIRQKFEIYEKEEEGLLVIYAYNLSKETRDKIAMLLLNDVHAVSDIPAVSNGLEPTFTIPDETPDTKNEQPVSAVDTTTAAITAEPVASASAETTTPVSQETTFKVPEEICCFDVETEDPKPAITNENLYDDPVEDVPNEDAFIFNPAEFDPPVSTESSLKELDENFVNATNDADRNITYTKLQEWIKAHMNETDPAKVRQYMVDGKHTAFTMLSKGIPDAQYESMIMARPDQDIVQIYHNILCKFNF